MAWWIWMVSGLFLMVLEVATPGGFWFLFFGFSALLVGIAAGLAPDLALWIQVLIFAALSVVLLLFFRGPMLRRMQASTSSQPPVEDLIDELAVPLEDMAPGATGRVELRGTPWTARNAGVEPIPRGARCRVTHVDGLTVTVRLECNGA
jgi:hypothetical protein